MIGFFNSLPLEDSTVILNGLTAYYNIVFQDFTNSVIKCIPRNSYHENCISGHGKFC